jgi:hypothetical protein
MVTTEAQAPGGTTFIQRWLARLAFVAAAAAVLVPPLSAGARHSLGLTLFGVAGLIVTVAAVWWALAYKGLVRWLAAAVAVAARWGCWSSTPGLGRSGSWCSHSCCWPWP